MKNHLNSRSVHRRRMRLGTLQSSLQYSTLEPRNLLAALPLITEFVASNSSGLVDENGDTSDWIEIYNAGDTSQNLDGWHLTDDATDLSKWSFPSVTLDAGEYMLVFASNKDRADADGTELHTNFKLGSGGEYLALVQTDGSTIAFEYAPQYPSQTTDVSYGLAMSSTNQTLVDGNSTLSYMVPTSGSLATSWMLAGFDDSGWASGTAGIGYEENPTASVNFASLINTTVASGTTSAYTRFEFSVANPSAISSLDLRMMYDDGFAAYLNGILVADDFAPDPLQWNSAATDGRGDSDVIEDFVAFDISSHLDELILGNNVLAIHALNTTTSSDMLMIAELVSSETTVDQPLDIGFLTTTTPGSVNGETFLGFVEDTSFSVDRGFFDAAFNVVVVSDTTDADIYYTLDGSAPSSTNGTLYSGAVNVSTTTILRAVATKPGFEPSNIDTQSYFFLDDVLLQDGSGLPLPPNSTSTWDYEMDPDIVNDARFSALVDDLQTLPTLSLVLDAQDAWGPNGFYSNPRESGQAWERNVSVEYIDTDGVGQFQENAGIRIMGSGSTTRALGKKSMRLVFRAEYGAKKLNYPFFGEDYADGIDTIAIRGNYFDTWTFQSDSGGVGDGCCGRSRSTYLRDQFAHESHDAMGAHAIAGNFVNLYINGQYWGIYNPSERPDEEFLQSYYGGEDTDYDVIKTGVDLVNGDLTAWNTMFSVARGDGANGSLANDAAYEEMKQLLDIEQFADYLLLNFYGGNNDWPHNNWYAARNRVTNSPFQFFEWDAENFLFSVNSNRTGVSSSNSAGELYDLLRQNDEFNLLFADRAQKHMFNDGALTPTASIDRFQNIVDNIRPALNAESARWGDELQTTPHNTIDDFDVVVAEKVNNYFPVRTGIVLDQLRSAGLFPDNAHDAPSFNQHGGLVPLGFDLTITNNESAGSIYYTLDGSDPRDVGDLVSGSAVLYSGAIDLNVAMQVNARLLRAGSWSALTQADFVVGALADASNLRITELNYNPSDPTASEVAAGIADNDKFEYVELMNTSSVAIELQSLVLSGAVDFTFIETASLAPGERVVLVEDQAAFEERYGTSIRIVGQWSGGLSNSSETLTLTDASTQLIVEFTYGDSDPWYPSTDGVGNSLQLVNETSTATDLYGKHYSWRDSYQLGGTPGAAPGSATPDIVINEVLAHTDLPQVDYIELYNAGASTVDVGGWYLSDSKSNLLKYQISAGTMLAAGGFLVFDESDFNPTPSAPGANDFALSSTGDQVWLTKPSGGQPFEIIDVAYFDATFNGQSVGRLPDGSGRLVHIDNPTLGESNRIHGLADLIISEVHYNPLPPTGNPVGVGDNDIEFVEVYNRSAQAIDLSQWRLRGDVDFNFPAVTLNPGQSVPVLAFDPVDPLSADKLNAFRTHYGINASVLLLGGFTGDLGNSYGRVSLQHSDDPPLDNPSVTPWITVDEVVYDDRAPFANADNNGQSLNRTTAASLGNAGSSWTATTPTPGSTSITVASLEGRSIFYNDSSFDSSSDDPAIGPDKQPLLPGETATFANYTSYDQGINGLFVDIASIESTNLIASDFDFATGNGNSLSDFTPISISPTIDVRLGEGTGGSDRVSLILPSGLITGTWLQVTVKSNAATGLSANDVFYFGNAIGETGDNGANARVDADDIGRVRNNLSGFFSVGSDSPYDFNRDGRVDATDIGIARNNLSGFFGLNLITAPTSGSSFVAGSSMLIGGDDAEIETFFRYAISTKERLCRIEKATSAQRDVAFSIPSYFEMQDFESIDRNKKSKR